MGKFSFILCVFVGRFNCLYIYVKVIYHIFVRHIQIRELYVLFKILFLMVRYDVLKIMFYLQMSSARSMKFLYVFFMTAALSVQYRLKFSVGSQYIL